VFRRVDVPGDDQDDSSSVRIVTHGFPGRRETRRLTREKERKLLAAESREDPVMSRFCGGTDRRLSGVGPALARSGAKAGRITADSESLLNRTARAEAFVAQVGIAPRFSPDAGVRYPEYRAQSSGPLLPM